MKKRISYLIFLFFFYSTSILFSQSPWTRKKGEFYTQLSFSTISNYDEIFGDPDYFTHREITDNTFQFYGEYGISDKTTIIINAPFKNIKTSDLTNETGFDTLITTSETINAFGNIELGLKHNFFYKKWLITGQLNIEFNTSTYDALSGIRTGFDAFTFTPLINFGRGYNKTYFQAFTGFNFRTNDYSSNFKIGGEGGFKIIDNIWLIGFLDFVISLNNGNYEVPLENALTALYVNDQEYTAFGLKAIGEITPNFGIIAGFGGAFSGNNVAKEAAINVGIYYKINN